MANGRPSKKAAPCCAVHRDRARRCVPAAHVVNGEPLCAPCFYGKPIFVHELGGEERRKRSEARVKIRVRHRRALARAESIRKFLTNILHSGKCESAVLYREARRRGFSHTALHEAKRAARAYTFRIGNTYFWGRSINDRHIPESL